MLKRSQRRTRQQSRDLLLAIALHGRYYPQNRFQSEHDVRAAYRAEHGIDFDAAAKIHELLIDAPIPYENLLPMHQWTVTGGVSWVTATGEAYSAPGGGQILTSHYEASFERMLSNEDDYLRTGDVSALLDAIDNGFNSTEDYVGYRAELWNHSHPGDPLIDDANHKVPFNKKLDEWIPKMSGSKVDKSDTTWQRYARVHALRNNAKTHKKASASAWGYDKSAEALNDLNYGVSGILIRMHKCFNEQVPPRILRTLYSPAFFADI